VDGQIPALLAGSRQGDGERWFNTVQIVGELHLELVMVDCAEGETYIAVQI